MGRSAALLVVIAALAGCTSPPSRFHAIVPLPASGPLRARAGPPIYIDSVGIPPEIDRAEMVAFETAYRVDVRGFDRWAAPLEATVARVLGFDLAARLPPGAVILRGEPRTDHAARSLDVVIERFAAGPGSSVVLDAWWTLAPAEGDGAPVRGHERITVAIASSEGEAIAAGMSDALARLAERVIDGAGRAK